MALLSKSCVYGIRAAIYLALDHESHPEKNGSDFIPISKIAKDLNISGHFLTKILQQLTSRELLASFRGPRGGVRLNRPSSDIKLLEIVDAIDGIKIFEDCALGLDGCGSYSPCPIHHQWAAQREQLREVFEVETLERLSHNTKELGMRIGLEIA